MELHPISIGLCEKLSGWKEFVWFDEDFVWDSLDDQSGASNWMRRGQLESLGVVVSSAINEKAIVTGILTLSVSDEWLYIVYGERLADAAWCTSQGGQLPQLLADPAFPHFLERLNGVLDGQLAHSLLEQITSGDSDPRRYVDDPVLLEVAMTLMRMMMPPKNHQGSP